MGGSGLVFGESNELRYSCNALHWTGNSGLLVPENQWVFTALVVEPNRATIYMDDGTLAHATLAAPHEPELFSSPSYIGADAPYMLRHLRGAIDDVRIYDRPLSQAQIEGVIGGDRARCPDPFDGASDVSSPLLKWAPGSAADSSHVYLGTNQTDVAAATEAAPEFRGAVTHGAFLFSGFRPDTLYHWRIDTVAGAQVTPGGVWSFTTAGDMDDYVAIPAMNVDTNTFTITAWLKRAVSVDGSVGIAFNHAGATRAGLRLGADHELRYAWGFGNWLWDSRFVVPADQWTFVALAIAPDGAVVYLNDMSAPNAAPHEPESLDSPTKIGQDQAPRCLAADVDDVAVWNRTLSPAEVRAVYYAGLQGRTIEDVRSPDTTLRAATQWLEY
jgi:hypothetical protein